MEPYDLNRMLFIRQHRMIIRQGPKLADGHTIAYAFVRLFLSYDWRCAYARKNIRLEYVHTRVWT